MRLQEIISRMREDPYAAIYFDVCSNSYFQNSNNVTQDISREEFELLEKEGFVEFEQIVGGGSGECYILTEKGRNHGI